MSRGLSRRAVRPELMDLHEHGEHSQDELREALRHLSRLNRIFGAAGPVCFGVNRLWQAAGKPKQLTVLDVGCGSGEINRAVLNWAEQNQVAIRVILADVTEEAQMEAQRLYAGEQRVVFERRSLFDFPAGYADFVTASQFAHHFADDELPEAVRRMLDISRNGIVLSDIHRHWISWTAVWIVTRLISRNRYIRHDGPLSVAKGFTRKDWAQLTSALGQPQLEVFWRPLFRWVLIMQKQGKCTGG